MNTAAYASASAQHGFAPAPAAPGPWQAKTRGSEPRSRQNIIGDSDARE